MSKFNVASDVPVIIEVNADSEEEAKALVEDRWEHLWVLMSHALEGHAQLGEWYDDTDVWLETE